jgi:mono/diheme cytochrome c family protein
MRLRKSGAGAPVPGWVFGLALAAVMGIAHAQPAGTEAVMVEKGRKLAVAADCAACHTAPKAAEPFAGGYPIQSPLGKIFASNITPSKTSGIGDYTLDDFSKSLRQGIRRDGAHLYPAMPYTSYTQLSDEDTAALYAYFMHGVAPVEKASPQTALPFPFSIRASMGVWNLLFLKDHRFAPDAAKSAEWNRGAYLAGALAHCSACHTPRNALMAEDSSGVMSGGSVGPWYAPNITSDANNGIGAWSEAELVKYLKTGGVAGKAQAAGPMAEAVENSLQHLPDEDLKAIAVFLKQSPAVAGNDTQPRFSYGKPSVSEVSQRGLGDGVDIGWRVFSGSCAHCHQANAGGTTNGEYPSLFNNTATGADRTDNLVAAILQGVNREVGGKHHFMPPFGDAASFTEGLSDTEVAAVSNYVLTQYGNPALHVSAHDVATQRAGGKAPLLARLQPFMVPGGVVLLLVVIAAIALVVLRRKARRESGNV